jgi:methylmalonyl-CoA mutase cobalamin-binding subunit
LEHSPSESGQANSLVHDDKDSLLLVISALEREPMQTHPKVLLATPPDERHDLGILALQSVLALTGAQCISLGTEVPASELIAAARSHQVQIVAVSFSIAYSSRRIAPFLKQIRKELPDSMQVWAGGAGLNALRLNPEGIRTFTHLEHAAVALTH